MQIIRQRIHRIDGVFYTHAHADHIFGLDDLRRFNAVMGTPIDIYTEAETLRVIQQCFFYIFNRHRNVNQTFIPDLIPRMVEPGVPLELYGARWTPLRLLHGRLPILGVRVDYPAGGSGEPPRSLAYCTDVSSIPPETYPLLHNLDVLVIDGLRYRHHPTHLSVDQAVEQIGQIRPRRAFLTHMAHDVKHADLEERLPEGVFLSYDGLKVTVESGGGAGITKGA
jgi:phosphoribosyl 1,2-cyclic phosphate phosphodiesterase